MPWFCHGFFVPFCAFMDIHTSLKPFGDSDRIALTCSKKNVDTLVLIHEVINDLGKRSPRLWVGNDLICKRFKIILFQGQSGKPDNAFHSSIGNNGFLGV